MPQFFIDIPFRAGADAQIRGADARHIQQVLRLTAGDWIVLSDGAGRSFRATIERASPGSVTTRIGEEIVRSPTAPAPALALAVIKGDRFEWAIQKAVEIGCRRILPFSSRRCVPRYATASDRRKLERWRRIALEAAKQSGLPFRPEVDPLEDFDRLIGRAREFRRIVLFYEGERENDLRKVIKPPLTLTLSPEGRGNSVSSPLRGEDQGEGSGREGQGEGALLIVGPEGGFADDEVKLARDAGIITASLGTQILRVETAAIVALAVWQYELGNMDAAPGGR